MKWLYLIIALIYLISPYDILPDFLGLPGRLDDLAVLVYIYWKYFRQEAPQIKSDSIEAEFVKVEKKDPYQILEIEKCATKDEIEERYKFLMTKYHPDKVNHLGDDLKKLAHEKTLEIQAAYQELVDKA